MSQELSAAAVYDREPDSEENGPSSTARQASADRRVSAAWREWLRALAHDPEATMAAALVYQSLPDAGRDSWLSALEAEAELPAVSRIAALAPLLAVENSPERRQRIARDMEPACADVSPSGVREFRSGRLPNGASVAAVTSPLHLDFVEILVCAFEPGNRFLWIRRNPIVRRDRAGLACEALAGVKLDHVSSQTLLDELARTILAVTRRGEPLPEELKLSAHLFGAVD